MSYRSLAVLIVINAVLLAGVATAVLSPREAQAQFGGGAQFTMIAGNAVGLNQEQAVYIIDLTRGRVLPVVYNTAVDRLTIFRGRDLSEDARRSIRNR